MNKIKRTFADSGDSGDKGDYIPKKKIVKNDDELPPPNETELTDEIRSFRQKNIEFQATNDHETYLIVCFSCKEDKKIFLENVKLSKEHTLIDGYKLAKNLNIGPTRPAFKLKGPLSK